MDHLKNYPESIIYPNLLYAFLNVLYETENTPEFFRLSIYVQSVMFIRK